MLIVPSRAVSIKRNFWINRVAGEKLGRYEDLSLVLRYIYKFWATPGSEQNFLAFAVFLFRN